MPSLPNVFELPLYLQDAFDYNIAHANVTNSNSKNDNKTYYNNQHNRFTIPKTKGSPINLKGFNEPNLNGINSNFSFDQNDIIQNSNRTHSGDHYSLPFLSHSQPGIENFEYDYTKIPRSPDNSKNIELVDDYEIINNSVLLSQSNKLATLPKFKATSHYKPNIWKPNSHSSQSNNALHNDNGSIIRKESDMNTNSTVKKKLFDYFQSCNDIQSPIRQSSTNNYHYNKDNPFRGVKGDNEDLSIRDKLNSINFEKLGPEIWEYNKKTNELSDSASKLGFYSGINKNMHVIYRNGNDKLQPITSSDFNKSLNEKILKTTINHDPKEATWMGHDDKKNSAINITRKGTESLPNYSPELTTKRDKRNPNQILEYKLIPNRFSNIEWDPTKNNICENLIYSTSSKSSLGLLLENGIPITTKSSLKRDKQRDWYKSIFKHLNPTAAGKDSNMQEEKYFSEGEYMHKRRSDNRRSKLFDKSRNYYNHTRYPNLGIYNGYETRSSKNLHYNNNELDALNAKSNFRYQHIPAEYDDDYIDSDKYYECINRYKNKGDSENYSCNPYQKEESFVLDHNNNRIYNKDKINMSYKNENSKISCKYDSPQINIKTKNRKSVDPQNNRYFEGTGENGDYSCRLKDDKTIYGNFQSLPKSKTYPRKIDNSFDGIDDTMHISPKDKDIHVWYSEVQKGGDVPYAGLQKCHRDPRPFVKKEDGFLSKNIDFTKYPGGGCINQESNITSLESKKIPSILSNPKTSSTKKIIISGNGICHKTYNYPPEIISTTNIDIIDNMISRTRTVSDQNPSRLAERNRIRKLNFFRDKDINNYNQILKSAQSGNDDDNVSINYSVFTSLAPFHSCLREKHIYDGLRARSTTSSPYTHKKREQILALNSKNLGHPQSVFHNKSTSNIFDPSPYVDFYQDCPATSFMSTVTPEPFDERLHKHKMGEWIEKEKLRKAREEYKKQEQRRHGYVPSSNSPIPVNRYMNLVYANDEEKKVCNGISPHRMSSEVRGGIYTSSNLNNCRRYSVSGAGGSPRSLFEGKYVRGHKRMIRAKARALFRFVAKNVREISFNKDDIIYLHHRIDPNWYEGEQGGMIGIFPTNYVKVLVSIEEAALLNANAEEGVAIARYNFDGKQTGEISFKKGDVIHLISELDDNWFNGKVANNYGLIPKSFIDQLRQPSSRKFSTNNVEDLSNNIQNLNISDGILSPKGSNDSLLRYRAIYSYNPQNDDELELTEGDIVFVKEKCEDGWYVGYQSKNKLFGTFPGNYVEYYAFK
ncbi:unnamed protein product [Gordionus sp. m RMFG-2023]